MARMVKCVLLGREAEGLDWVPYPGDLGKRLYDNVSKEAWQRYYFKGEFPEETGEAPKDHVNKRRLKAPRFMG